MDIQLKQHPQIYTGQKWIPTVYHDKGLSVASLELKEVVTRDQQYSQQSLLTAGNEWVIIFPFTLDKWAYTSALILIVYYHSHSHHHSSFCGSLKDLNIHWPPSHTHCCVCLRNTDAHPRHTLWLTCLWTDSYLPRHPRGTVGPSQFCCPLWPLPHYQQQQMADEPAKGEKKKKEFRVFKGCNWRKKVLKNVIGATTRRRVPALSASWVFPRTLRHSSHVTSYILLDTNIVCANNTTKKDKRKLSV